MSTRISDRIRWGVDAIGIQPSDHVLEIGCGHGVAVSLVCDRLDDGRITAIDRSAKMIAAARTRNARCIDAGKADLVRVAFPDDDLGGRRFSKVFAIHVPLFRGDRDAALARLRRLVAPGGTVHLIGQPLRDEDVAPWVRSTTGHLAAAGLDVLAPRFSDHRPVRTACVSATMTEAG